MNPLADPAIAAPYFSPLDEALIRCHMEVSQPDFRKLFYSIYGCEQDFSFPSMNILF